MTSPTMNEPLSGRYVADNHPNIQMIRDIVRALGFTPGGAQSNPCATVVAEGNVAPLFESKSA
jgi:hypothetical protein